MKKVFLMGRSEAGKTSLTQALKGEELHYHKTQYTNSNDDTIDSPGEYAESKHFSVGLACFSFEADVIAIVQAANAYLAVQGCSCRAYDLTGAEEAELASQLQAGNPVIFWATLHFGDIQHDPCGEYDLPGGRRHEVLHTLHCMVLCGMDDQNFVVADPLDFNRVVPRVQFMKIYRQLGRRAVVIKKDS